MTEPIVEEELRELEKIHAESTPGQWRARGDDVDCPVGGVLARVYSDSSKASLPFKDARAIAALHNAFPALVARIRALEADRERAQNSALTAWWAANELTAEAQRLGMYDGPIERLRRFNEQVKEGLPEDLTVPGEEGKP
jgi:hypothetical protein